MSSYSVTAWACNNKGKVRSNNEDNLYLDGKWIEKEKMDEGSICRVSSEQPLQFFAVCDGMGGEESGEIASFTAVSHLDAIKQIGLPQNDLAAIQNGIVELNNQVYAVAKANDAQGHCGTTLTALLVSHKQFITLNIGDSRVYLFRRGKLRQLTKDHTEVQRMVDMGFLGAEAAKSHPKRHIITRHLGMNPEAGQIEATISEVRKVRHGDLFVLCSDGLHDLITDDQIQLILKQGGRSEELVDAALDAGGSDNVTVITVLIMKKRWFSKETIGSDKS